MTHHDILKRMYYAQEEQGLPAAYRRVAWLRSSSTVIYIDTGVTDTEQDLECECRVRYGQRVSYGGIFGSYADESKTSFRLMLTNIISEGSASGYANGGYRAGSAMLISNMPAQTWLEITLQKDMCVVNGIAVMAPSGAVVGGANSRSITLFKTNGVNSATPLPEFAFFVLRKKGKVIRDLVPAVRKADNKPGMYDMANKMFYLNAGGTAADFTWQEL